MVVYKERERGMPGIPMLEGPLGASNVNITPKEVPDYIETIEVEPKEVKPNRFQFCRLMGHLNSLLQGEWVNQFKLEWYRVKNQFTF